jgi:hypothetical protein
MCLYADAVFILLRHIHKLSSVTLRGTPCIRLYIDIFSMSDLTMLITTFVIQIIETLFLNPERQRVLFVQLEVCDR